MTKIWFAKFGNSRISFWNGRVQKHFSVKEKAEIQDWTNSIEGEVFALSVLANARSYLKNKKLNFNEVKIQMIPIRPAYREGIGIDRLVNAYSAHHLSREHFVVIDCGTAVCVDFVTKDAVHLGGWIGVGPGLAASALHEGTSQLSYVQPRRLSSDQIGRSTRTCIERGLVNLVHSNLLEAERFAPKLFKTSRYRIFVTGGWSKLVTWPSYVCREPMLTFLGLKKLWESQRMKR